MLKQRIIAVGLTVCTLFSISGTALAESIMIAQGSTAQIGDNIQIYNAFNNNNAYNGGKINRGWQYSNQTILSPVSGPTDFKDAANVDVLYWTGHGAKGAVLNPKLSTTVNVIKNATQFNANSYISSWKNGRLKVAIFAACYQLDKGSGSADVYAKAMQNSNVRVVAGYHETGPSKPIDANIATEFMKQINNSESVRNAWMLANQKNGCNGRWATLNYKSNDNQYYRMPGFNFKNYAAPTNKTVYRFYSSSTNPSSGGQIIRNSNDNEQINIQNLPQELIVNKTKINLDTSSLYDERNITNINLVDNVYSFREMHDGHTISSIDGKQIADNFLQSIAQTNILEKAAVEQFNLKEDSFDSISGQSVLGSERLIGESTIYYNTYNSVRIIDNYMVVNTDSDGIFSIINNWNDFDIVGEDERTIHSNKIDIDTAKNLVANSLKEDDQINSVEVVYADIDGIYRLSYAINTTNNSNFIVDCETGFIIQKTN